MLTSEQLELRKKYVTGSDVGAILGVNKYQTPVQLWQLKTGRISAEDISDKPAVKAGNMLESAVADWFTLETGKEVYRDEKFFIHPEYNFMGGHIDRMVKGESALLECKTTQHEDGWGEGYVHGDNRIPDSYLAQVIHYCACAMVERAYIAVLIRGIDFRYFIYERNVELEKRIIKRESDFWFNHVIADVAPTPVSSDEVIELLQGNVSDACVAADEGVEIDIATLKDVREQIKNLEAVEKECKDRICVYMADRQVLLDKAGRIVVTWKQREGSVRFDSKAFKDSNPDLYKLFESRGTPVRTFLVK